jgi:hypothetical protein
MAYAGEETRRQRGSSARTHETQPRRRGSQAPDRTSGKATTRAVPDPSLVAMLDRLREVATAHDHDDEA